MSQIRSRNTKPEIMVRKFLHSAGFRFRLHNKKLPGTPDITLPKYKTAVLIHGCFWHGHQGCRYFVMPQTRTEWWQSKISRNTSNDKKNLCELSALGWKVIEIWECTLKKNLREATLEALANNIRGQITDSKANY